MLETTDEEKHRFGYGYGAGKGCWKVSGCRAPRWRHTTTSHYHGHTTPTVNGYYYDDHCFTVIGDGRYHQIMLSHVGVTVPYGYEVCALRSF